MSSTFQFDNDYLEFRNQIENLRAMLQNFMDTWFAKSLTVSTCILNLNNSAPLFICTFLVKREFF